MSYHTLTDLFKGICDAVRKKEGSAGVISHQDIPERIAGMSAGNSLYIFPEYIDVAMEVNPFITVNQSDIIIEEETE